MLLENSYYMVLLHVMVCHALHQKQPKLLENGFIFINRGSTSRKLKGGKEAVIKIICYSETLPNKGACLIVFSRHGICMILICPMFN